MRGMSGLSLVVFVSACVAAKSLEPLDAASLDVEAAPLTVIAYRR
jgi:hypothetical protein